MVDVLAGVGRAFGLFVVAGIAEIGGGWLVWQWLRLDRGWSFGIFGGLTLILYGVIPTFQSESAFGRVYAAYGGVFVLLALLWGRVVDGWSPDRWDLLGAGLCIGGVAIMLFIPRGSVG
jgi:small multidrug resistance family-3 protein